MNPNMPSSGRVDVRAVLNEAAKLWWRERFRGDAERAELAIAAIDELIEADRRIDFTPLDELADDATCVITVTAGDLRRRAAALANIGAAP